MFHHLLSDANKHGGFGGRFLVIVLAGLLCSITFFLMQMSTVVSEEDRGGCSCW
jgi:hypothetical protein